MDICGSIIGIIVASPIMLVLCALIKLTSPGPLIYRQERVGLHNQTFWMYKFRSMEIQPEAEEKKAWTVKNDPRVTAIGRFMRRTSLDELPQLFNILKGDMSLVGPRPEVRKYVDLYTDEQKKVLSVRPGITDYASIEYVDENMILGEASDPDRAYIEQIMPDKIRYNMKYICNRSVKEYFKIIFLTFWSIIR